MPEIGDYAIIGDTHTAALIDREGSIDWCCLPRFDSPAVFLRLLDTHRGGFFRVAPVGHHTATRRYLPSTNVLETTFLSAHGGATLTDFMPWSSELLAEEVQPIVRIVEALGESTEVAVDWAPTFDYARASATLHDFDGGVVAVGGLGSLALLSPGKLTRDGLGGVHARLSVAAGQKAAFVCAFGPSASAAIEAARAVRPTASLEHTTSAWRDWSARCTYEGAHRELIQRAALILKLLTYAPTGAMIASPTTSLPEATGGSRNWDYRYVWLRDSALMLRALMALGHHSEAQRFFDWLETLCIACGCRAPIRIAYTVGGSPVPCEEELEHLAGFGGARPVRIGNAAGTQIQLDVFGEVLDAAWTCQSAMGWRRPNLWAVLVELADHAARRWRDPDAGIWEMRRSPAHHVGSKLLCWVALDRAIRLAASLRVAAGDVEHWETERAAIRATILRDGFDESLGTFTQTLGSRALDASALRIPLLGFLPASDPRVRSTVERIRARLCDRGLVRRYVADDGLPHGEGAFALCTSWLVAVLADMGRVEDAQRHLEALVASANDVGLMAEEIDPETSAPLGNFPQGFTHLGLIDCVIRVEHATRMRGR